MAKFQKHFERFCSLVLFFLKMKSMKVETYLCCGFMQLLVKVSHPMLLTAQWLVFQCLHKIALIHDFLLIYFLRSFKSFEMLRFSYPKFRWSWLDLIRLQEVFGFKSSFRKFLVLNPLTILLIKSPSKWLIWVSPMSLGVDQKHSWIYNYKSGVGSFFLTQKL